jgi:uncharacterized repeat protein (TIGR01451 family)
MKKIIYLAMVLVLALSLLAVPAFAADGSVNVTVTADKTDVQPGDTVTYTISVNNTTGKDVGGLEFTVQASDNLEYVSKKELCKDLFDMAKYNADKNQFDGTTSETVGITDTTWDVCQLTYTVKSGTVGDVTLDLTVTQCYTAELGSLTNSVSGSKLTVPCTNHAWDAGDVTKAATCTAEGEKTYTCTVCNETKTEAVAKIAHTVAEEKVGVKEATCTEEGNTGDTVCAVCGEVLTAGEAIPATGHSYTTEVTAATCSAEGKTVYTCSKGDDTYTETIEKIDHTPEVVDAKDATCYEEGYTGDTVCSVCGEELEKGEAIEKIAHTKADGDEGTITILATAKEPGKKTCVCAVDECGQEFTESYEAVQDFKQEATIPASVLEKAGVSTVEELQNKMKPTGTTTYTNIQVFEVTLMVDRGDGKGSVEATTGDFPLTILLRYPDGITASNYSKYEFAVTHLKDDGTVETLKATATADGLEVTVNSLSPIAISWKDAPVASSGNSTGSTAKGSNVPNTGDNSAIVLWAVMLSVCAMGAVTVVASKKKTSK